MTIKHRLGGSLVGVRALHRVLRVAGEVHEVSRGGIGVSHHRVEGSVLALYRGRLEEGVNVGAVWLDRLNRTRA